MLLISKLLNGYNSADVNVRYLVESIDWYITAVLNPDGFVFVPSIFPLFIIVFPFQL